MSTYCLTSKSNVALGSAPGPNDFQQASIAELVSAQARVNPEAIAVEQQGHAISYRDLDERASELAGHLRSLGVDRNVVVGLCLQRSVAMVVAALGVLKAGGAYLPLDPAYPAARLAYILGDARVPALLIGDCIADRIPAGSWQAVRIDGEGNRIGSGTSTGSSAPVTICSDDLAYVIYTSGSTGQPKGVEITYGGLMNLVRWHQSEFSVSSADRATQMASPGFDAAVWEVWPYLTAGASIHLPNADVRLDPKYLRDWIVEQAITITFVPTPMAEQLIQLDWPANAALRVLLTGADTLHHFPPANIPFTLVNNYGPTECTVVTTSGPVLPAKQASTLPPIGRPISNVQVYIVDEDMQQLPAGAHGELCIGGAGLARGYRNRPDLTAERFVPNPFSPEPGARLYKTGDLAAYLPDGQIAFLGRIDDQVKILGFRIEPSEIVAVLDKHSMVHASFVMAREDEPGKKRLTAYVLPEPDARPTDKELREFLANEIPDYMLPSVFVRVDFWPVNASGKIDRSALPAPTEANILKDESFVAPRTPIEQRVAFMLGILLHVEKVGLNDNFFLLGGNSLLGAQVIARVRDTFGVDLSLLGLFDNPTIAALSSEIERLLVAKVDAMSDFEAERLAADFSKIAS